MKLLWLLSLKKEGAVIINVIIGIIYVLDMIYERQSMLDMGGYFCL